MLGDGTMFSSVRRQVRGYATMARLLDDVSGMLSEFFAFAKEVQHDFISSEHNPPGGPQQGSASEAGALPYLAQHLASSHCAYPAQDV
ncbi:hypothetical protein QJQ45_021426 [Haematococcus lacustris]|nr:hypothetical protein QJQ45_021426 [Haematococcus lacustris]